jgi:hypothetical protein
MMTRLRVTIAQLMAVVLMVGMATAALRNNAQEPRDRITSCGIVLDRPNGHVTAVDSERAVVRVDITRRWGARPKMKMAVFDSESPRVSIDNIDKPKGMIELVEAGEQFSTARIIKTNRSTVPIRVGDAVYSPAWFPNSPPYSAAQFALVGEIDFNHDGKDDRDELKRLIAEAGGRVAFDLPPPDVGRESGIISPRIDWYAFDGLPTSRRADSPKSERSPSRPSQFERRVDQVIKEARLNGIRPIPVARLLPLLGYGIRPSTLGRPETAKPDGVRPVTASPQAAVQD